MTRKGRRVEVVPEIEAHRPDGRLVAYTNPDGVRNVTIVAFCGCTLLQAKLGISLLPTQQIVQHVPSRGEDVARVMEEGEAQLVLDQGKHGRRKTHLQVIEEQRPAAHGKAEDRIARTRLIQAKTAMRVAAARQEQLGQRNALGRSRGGALSGGKKNRISKRSLH